MDNINETVLSPRPSVPGRIDSGFAMIMSGDARKRILVIDDDDAIRLGFMDLLQRHKFQVYGAENGKTGVRLAMETRPDLIICDIAMPLLDGFGVLRELREDVGTASIPLIFLTGRTERTDQRFGMELGAYDYLTKPCTGDEMLRAISAALAKHEAVAKVYITELRRAEEEVDYLVHHDPLTGLSNLRSLRLEFNRLLARSNGIGSMGVMVLKPDRYERFLEFLGPVGSEELWKSVARKLKALLQGDRMAARLPQGELAMILEEPTVSRGQEAVLEIQQSLAGEYQVDNQEVFLTFNSGISWCPTHGTEIDTLLQCAHFALERAAAAAPGTSIIFDQAFQSDSRLEFESRLRHALEKSQLSLNFQPQVNLVTGEIMGAEALVRWNDPERGFIPPGVFIPIAEEAGIMIEMGSWILSTACRQAVEWQTKFGKRLRIAVNLSGKQFHDAGLATIVSRVIRETGIDPELLELEIVESTIIEDSANAATKLEELRALGVRIAMDDFGTGYSSLSYLRSFHFDVLKMDRSFVRDISSDFRTAAIGKAMIQLAHNLRAKVVAEGVETREEFAFLKSERCDEVQGYLISAPLRADDFAEFLHTYRRVEL